MLWYIFLQIWQVAFTNIYTYIYITKGDMLQNTCCAYKLLTCASAEILGYI